MSSQTQQIVVGDLSVPWDSFQPTEDFKEVVLIENGIETVVGQTSEQVVEVQIGDELCLQRTQILLADQVGTRRGVSVVRKATFAPISNRSFWNGETVEKVPQSQKKDRQKRWPLTAHSLKIIQWN